jgi:hypothetical protein
MILDFASVNIASATPAIYAREDLPLHPPTRKFYFILYNYFFKQWGVDTAPTSEIGTLHVWFLHGDAYIHWFFRSRVIQRSFFLNKYFQMMPEE